MANAIDTNNSVTSTVALRPDLNITVTEAGAGRPVLILHGGGGPFTVASIAKHLSGTMHTIIPIHPGWNSTPRPEVFSRVSDIATAYLQYLEENGLQDVLVIGSSLGGWLGSEMAVQDKKGLITGLILINAAGINVAGEPIVDFFALDARGVAEHSFHDADRFYVDPATAPPAQVATQRANMATMRVYAGDPYMHDPTLLGRLNQVEIPVLVIWGESDRIFTQAFGAAYAHAFQDGHFELVKEAGHLPQIEQPAATFALIDEYIEAQVS